MDNGRIQLSYGWASYGLQPRIFANQMDGSSGLANINDAACNAEPTNLLRFDNWTTRLLAVAQRRNSQLTALYSPIVFGLRPKRVYFALPRARTLSTSKSALLILLSIGLALVLSFAFREGSVRPAAPAIFLLVIISVAHFSGRLASLLVAAVGGLIFAAFLFEPFGSFAVYSAADRIALLSFALASIAVACLSRNSDSTPE